MIKIGKILTDLETKMLNHVIFIFKCIGISLTMLLFYVFWLEYKFYEEKIHDFYEFLNSYELLTKNKSYKTNDEIQVYWNDYILSKQNEVENLFNDPLNFFIIEMLSGLKIKDWNKHILKKIILEQMIYVQQNNINIYHIYHE